MLEKFACEPRLNCLRQRLFANQAKDTLSGNPGLLPVPEVFPAAGNQLPKLIQARAVNPAICFSIGLRCVFFQVNPGGFLGQIPDLTYICGSFRNANHAAGIQQIEGMRAAQKVVVGRESELFLQQIQAFLFVSLKDVEEEGGACRVEVIFRKLQFPGKIVIAVEQGVVPARTGDSHPRPECTWQGVRGRM